jgi:membrane associated rhomboid family serine protease
MEVMDIARFEAPEPWGPRAPHPQDPDYRPPPEPAVNAPWPVVVASVGVIAIYILQTQAPFLGPALAFSPAQLVHGHLEGLITHQFVHGSWPHVLINAGFILAFGAPVSRFLGGRAGGAVAFFGFFFLCGVLGALGFAFLHWGVNVGMVGASGAGSGLMGGAARLIGGDGRVGPVFSRSVIAMGAAWVVVNIIMAFTGGALMPGAGDAGIAWEAHLAGFAAGVLLIGPFGWLAGRR